MWVQVALKKIGKRSARPRSIQDAADREKSTTRRECRGSESHSELLVRGDVK